MNRPPDDMLQQFASLDLWKVAEEQARRSTMRRYLTGAVAYYGMGNHKSIKVYAKACSYRGLTNISVHAEQDLCRKLDRVQYGGAMVLIVTLGKAGNYAHSSRPCISCAQRLANYAWGIIYADRDNTGEWTVHKESPSDLVKRAGLRMGPYAREQRIPAA